MGFLLDETKGDGRYDLEKFVEMVNAGGVDMYDPSTSVLLNRLGNLEAAGTIVVSAEDENHPEFLSYSIYGTVDYWALLMHYNNMCLHTEIKVGVQVKYFRLSDLENLYFRLKPMKASGTPVSAYGGSEL